MHEPPPRRFDHLDPRAPIGPGEDVELERVAASLLRLDPDGARTAEAIRETFDQLLDGQRTGRWDYRDLRKTEKTHMGTLVEINLHREFEFEDGLATNYRIADAEVDCKFSQSWRGWQIPLETLGHLCLLLWADDERSLFSGALLRITEDVLRPGGNRDQKRTLNDTGVARMRRLWHERAIPENLLLHLDGHTRARIFAFPGRRNGQRRVDELFRLVQGRIVSRTAVLTVAQQDDPPKRVRDSRIRLRPEGIVILGHQGDHPRIARALELPAVTKGQWVGTRLVPCELAYDGLRVSIRGTDYRPALPDDPPEPAPLLDSQREQR
jgi:Restriction endonuclease NaeI